jgi:hypothetical protein
MKSVDKIRTDLINKILSMEDKEMLVALDKIVSTPSPEEIVRLTSGQSALLDLSERDIQDGKLIDQDKLDQMDREWLSAG